VGIETIGKYVTVVLTPGENVYTAIKNIEKYGLVVENETPEGTLIKDAEAVDVTHDKTVRENALAFIQTYDVNNFNNN
jgi:hypothetical protein